MPNETPTLHPGSWCLSSYYNKIGNCAAVFVDQHNTNPHQNMPSTISSVHCIGLRTVTTPLITKLATKGTVVLNQQTRIGRANAC